MKIYKYLLNIYIFIYSYIYLVESRPYGSWYSPISANLSSTKFNLLLEAYPPTATHAYWLERRPNENGRAVLVEIDNYNNQRDLLPPGFGAFTYINSYGGGPITIISPPISGWDRYFSFLFVNQYDQMLYLHYPNVEDFEPVKMTSDSNKIFADGCYDALRNRAIFVCEDSTNPNKVTQSLVSLDLDTKELITLESSYDFYMSPRISPDGRKLAYVAWNFPNMPWDQNELLLVDLDRKGLFLNKQKLSYTNESVMDPKFDANYLYYVSDRIYGYWTIFRYDLFRRQVTDSIPPSLFKYKEIGTPTWTLGVSFYAILPNSRIIAKSYGYLIDYSFITRRSTLYQNQFTQVRFVSYSKIHRAMTIIGSSIKQLQTLVRVSDLDRNTISFTRLLNDQIQIDPDYISEPIEIKFNTTDGGVAYGFYYAPKNPLYDNSVQSGEKPPLLVKTHGGPTGYAAAQLLPSMMFWTSRGFAVLDVNYRGSSQYGREYRQLLNGNWGIYDVDDSVAGAQYLVDKGFVDKNRLVIDGQSSGGYTTLATLTTKKLFQAGCSFFGIGDLVNLAEKTDRLELKYVQTLVGDKNLVERSPINHIDHLDVPVAFFHGVDDPIVPCNQSQQMYQALIQRNRPTLLELYPGEQHGFSQNKNIIRSLEGEYYFFAKVLNFEPVNITNTDFNIVNLKR